MAKSNSGGDEDRIDTIVITIMAAVIGIVLLCSFAIPTIFGTAGLGALTDAQNSEYGGLIKIIVIVLIFGLIIPIVRGYNSRQR